MSLCLKTIFHPIFILDNKSFEFEIFEFETGCGMQFKFECKGAKLKLLEIRKKFKLSFLTRKVNLHI